MQVKSEVNTPDISWGRFRLALSKRTYIMGILNRTPDSFSDGGRFMREEDAVRRVFEMASVTPPVGMNVYVIHGVAKDVPMSTIFRGIIPFLIADVCHLILLIAFPQIVLFVPNLMK